MLLVSSHILDCGEIELPSNAVIRVNLAWLNSVEEACEKLGKISHNVFLDNPIGRVKPPNNQYNVEDLVTIINRFNNIKYLAISNVESRSDVFQLYDDIPDKIIIVPKIETVRGVENIASIAGELKYDKNFVMIDHDDLCTDLIRHAIHPRLLYTDYIDPMIRVCSANGVNVLRTQGIVFSTRA